MLNYKYYLIVFTILLTSCKKEGWTKFESNKWKPAESIYIEKYRKQMVFDLVHNVLKPKRLFKKANTQKEIEQLLGKPNYKVAEKQKTMYSYLIEEKFDYDIDPNGKMELNLYFDEENFLTHWIINESWYIP